ncbi:PREDICTED: uncharacterized protein LOC109240679 [Nicotiana attenuata]|uniref:DUF868 domain-containing protein n=1 Tax=Nicotiana attenuata TaxID=49451 RepID=A0A314L7H5_NICAT|nr:PREDICTED: uncharacterized protein LOC109240679 [Nicotiana attenuata]OIT37505.1 hypothetical protein A4A49_05443 [Nicotiana attenuata]
MEIVAKSKKHHHYYSPLPSCFRRPLEVAAAATARPLPPPPLPQPPVAANPNLATSLYQTHLGLFALTWSRNLFGRSFHIHFLLNDSDGVGADCNNNSISSPHLSSTSTPSFHLNIKPFIFWKKHGSKKLDGDNKVVHIFWDLSKAKFGSGPEPISGFYVAVIVNGEMVLLVGDLNKEAYAKTRARKPEKKQNQNQNPNPNQNLVLRREHVCGNKLYKTKANFGGKEKEISIDCRLGEDPRLYFSVDNKRVLQIKHLKWKFRGNERIEVDGIPVLVSWDVYNWLFDDDEDGYALFMFKFEKSSYEYVAADDFNFNNGVQLWSQQSCGFGFETKMMKKGVLRSSRSSSSSSLSSASSTCSSVMEWASTEENELKGPSGFSLLVYAWKS